MSFLNADVSNAVNPYLTDVGVGLVFGLGYYFIKYLYGETQPQKSWKGEKLGQVSWDAPKTIEEFNQLIRSHEENPKLNPFEVLDKINSKHLTPDVNTYNNLLNACYIAGNYESAEKLVEEMFDFASPVQPDLSTFNIMLKGVSCRLDSQTDESEKAQLVETADKIFNDIKKSSIIKPNDITINTTLDILIKGGHIQRAWDLFDNMKVLYDVEPDKYSYSTIIKALKYELDASKLDKAFGILEFLKTKNGAVSNDEIIFNCLIDVCLKLNEIEKAEKVFQEMKGLGVLPSKITYAIMIKGYGHFYNLEKAFEMFEEMKENNIQPNEIIYGCLLNACVRCANIKKVTEVYLEMKKNNIEMNIILYTTLIKAYTKVKDLGSAFDVYTTMINDEKVSPNIVIHNAMLDCCVECNNITKMNEIYELIKEKAIKDENQPQPDLITYSTVIKGYCRAKDMDKVFDIYEFLTSGNDFVLDEVIYNSILDGCAKTGNFERGLKIYEDMTKNNCNKSNVTYSILVKLYANNKSVDKALSLLDEMISKGIKPEIIVYTCLIQTCLRNKLFEKAISLFEQLKQGNLKPDHVLYNTIVNGCLYNHKWELACEYTLESFNANIRMASDIYRNVLDKISMNYCQMRTNKKCEFATMILKELKNKKVSIDDETYQKVCRMIYKNQGVKVDLNSKSPEYRDNQNNYDSNKNYKQNNYDSNNNYKQKKYYNNNNTNKTYNNNNSNRTYNNYKSYNNFNNDFSYKNNNTNTDNSNTGNSNTGNNNNNFYYRDFDTQSESSNTSFNNYRNNNNKDQLKWQRTNNKKQ